MAFFYDVDNPAVQQHFENENKIEEQKLEVELYNGLSDMDLDIVLALDVNGNDEEWVNVLEEVVYDETVHYEGDEGDRLLALKAGTDEIVAEFHIKSGQSLYAISRPGETMGFEL